MEPDRRSFRLTGNKLLMVGLIVMIIFQVFMRSTAGIALEDYFGLEPSKVVDQFYFWQPLTYQFLQQTGSVLEFVFVLIGLFFFGPIVESRWGWRKYLLLFGAAGLFGGLIYTPLGYVFRHTSNPLLGSVPPVMAIMVMAAMTRPNMPVLLFFILPVKMKYMIWLFVGVDLLLVIDNPIGSIAVAVPHLAGALFGFLYSRYHRRIDQFFASLEPDEPALNGTRQPDRSRSTTPNSPYSDEVDDILDKINEQGINSLTPEERQLLKEASDQLKGDDQYDLF
jgi:membrane associated rhomboid family serine protease